MPSRPRLPEIARVVALVVVASVALAGPVAAVAEASPRAVDADVDAAHRRWEASVPAVRSAARALERLEAEHEPTRKEAAAVEAAREEALARLEAARVAVDDLQARLVGLLAETHLAQIQRDAATGVLEEARAAARSRTGEMSSAGLAAADASTREEVRIRTVHGTAHLDAVTGWHAEVTETYESLRAELNGLTEQRNAASFELQSADRAYAEAASAAEAARAKAEPGAVEVREHRDALEQRQAEHDRALADLRALGWRAGVLGQGGLVWPTDGPPGSRFGTRRHPISGRVRLHAGVDVPAPTGQNVVATRAGTVVFAGVNGGYGFMVDIDHGDGRVSRYAHLSYLHVRRGDRVGQAQRIGRVGSTGASTGPHLHFEYLVGGQPQDPLRWFAGVIGG